MNLKNKTSSTQSSKYTVWILLILGTALVGGVVYFLRPFNQAPLQPETSSVSTHNVNLGTAQDIDRWITAEIKRSANQRAIVNVWATWCEPCRREMPELAKFKKENPDISVFLVSADNESDIATTQKFLTDSGVDFLTMIIQGSQDSFIETWQERSNKEPDHRWSMSLPVTFLLNQDAQVTQFISGATNAKELKSLFAKNANLLR